MPRTRTYESGAERVAAYRARRGGKQLNVYLDPPAADALERLAAERGIKPTIEQLIIEADRAR